METSTFLILLSIESFNIYIYMFLNLPSSHNLSNVCYKIELGHERGQKVIKITNKPICRSPSAATIAVAPGHLSMHSCNLSWPQPTAAIHVLVACCSFQPRLGYDGQPLSTVTLSNCPFNSFILHMIWDSRCSLRRQNNTQRKSQPCSFTILKKWHFEKYLVMTSQKLLIT